jgi:hypothetical protein
MAELILGSAEQQLIDLLRALEPNDPQPQSIVLLLTIGKLY